MICIDDSKWRGTDAVSIGAEDKVRPTVVGGSTDTVIIGGAVSRQALAESIDDVFVSTAYSIAGS